MRSYLVGDSIVDLNTEIVGATADAAALAEGERAFTAMKDAANRANWPASLRDEVIFLDKSWQGLKAAPDADAVKSITAKMVAMTKDLDASTNPLTRKVAGLPVYGWVGVGVGGLVLVGALTGLIFRRK